MLALLFCLALGKNGPLLDDEPFWGTPTASQSPYQKRTETPMDVGVIFGSAGAAVVIIIIAAIVCCYFSSKKRDQNERSGASDLTFGDLGLREQQQMDQP